MTGDGRHLFLQRRHNRELGSAGGADPWKPLYRFDLKPREFGDYEDMCVYHQTSPKSTFTRRRVCTRATLEGRVTLSGLRLITTTQGYRREELLDGDGGEYLQVLRERFGIELRELAASPDFTY